MIFKSAEEQDIRRIVREEMEAAIDRWVDGWAKEWKRQEASIAERIQSLEPAPVTVPPPSDVPHVWPFDRIRRRHG